jgi:hypothetical protein
MPVWTKYEFVWHGALGLQMSTWKIGSWSLNVLLNCFWPGLGFISLQLVSVTKVPACFEFQSTWIMSTSIPFLLFPSLCLHNLPNSSLVSVYFLDSSFHKEFYPGCRVVVQFIVMWEWVQFKIQISRMPDDLSKKLVIFPFIKNLTYWAYKPQRLLLHLVTFVPRVLIRINAELLILSEGEGVYSWG